MEELNALIKRCVDGGCDPRTSLTNCYGKQIPCSGTTTSKSIWKPSLLAGIKSQVFYGVVVDAVHFHLPVSGVDIRHETRWRGTG